MKLTIKQLEEKLKILKIWEKIEKIPFVDNCRYQYTIDFHREIMNLEHYIQQEIEIAWMNGRVQQIFLI